MKENPAGEMRKFRIEGLDCARCALRIETALRRIEGFDEAQVSFGTRTIRIPADARGTAEQVIARIEPDVRLQGLERREHSERTAAENGGERLE